MSYAADFRRIAREALRGKWALAIGTGFIAVLLGAVSRGGSSSNGGGRESQHQQFLPIDISSTFYVIFASILVVVLLWALITFFMGGAIELGYCRFNKNLINNTDAKFTDLFSRFDCFWKAFGLRLLIAIFTFLWTLLFIIPGIIAAFSYSMAFYIMEENPSTGIMEAISQSKQMMRGNKFRLFCLAFSFIGWILLSVFTLGLGMLWVGPYMNASFAAFYLEISGEN